MSTIDPDILMAMYRAIFVTRKAETRLVELYRQNLVKGTVLTGEGNEAAVVGLATALDREQDVCNLMQRDFAGYLVWGMPLYELYCHYFGNRDSPTGGKDGNVHHGDLSKRLLPMISHLGAMLPNVVGATYALRQKGSKGIGAAIIGDGGTSTGDFHEALNIASVLDVPVLFFVENNHWAYSTPLSSQYRVKHLSDRAASYGIEGRTIDGTNPVTVYSAVREVAEEIRARPRPYLLETLTYRFTGHAVYDTGEYMPKEELKAWRCKDPLAVARRELLLRTGTGEPELEALEAEWEQMVNSESNRALATMRVISDGVDWRTYAPAAPPALPPLSAPGLTPVHAINRALHHAMDNDTSVLVLGEDIGAYGGPFKCTRGLFAKHGRARVIDMPLAESGFTGFAVGCAEMGMRPVVEMQFADFSTDAFTQIALNAGTFFFRNGSPIPLTIRMPTGGGLSFGPFHSQELEAVYGTFPGIKIVYPSSVQDFFDLLLASIFDPNPVMFFESKYLYGRITADVSFSGQVGTLEGGRVVKTGSDLTVVCWGAMVHEVTAAALALEAERDCAIEILDPRILKPMDLGLVVESVARTHRLLVVHEAWPSASFGSDIIAAVARENFFDLDAPPARVSPPDTPVPFAPELERVYRPSAAGIRQSMAELLDF
jgi:2-oxoisovalerate dehydrogenase E1 component